MMPVVSDSTTKTKCVLPSVQQLKMVFALCDPQQTGIVRVDHLQELAKHYAAEDTKELEDILRLFDPQEKGAISFREFYKGVRSILRMRHHDEKNTKCRESMMSPSPAPVTEPAIDHQREPRFVLTPSTPSSPPPPTNGDVPTTERDQPLSKSQCSSLSDGENYECYGEGVELDLDSGIASDRTNGDPTGARSPLNHSGINRHTWLRTSLRRSPPSHQENLPNRRWGSFRHSGKRQLGSNALASQLYRSSSFNSSGRSSTCDTADDMYSDVSLEEDVVLDLNHRLHSLQQQVGELKDSANHNDERYTRAKAENAALQARVHMLEEQLREAEVRHEDRLQDEQRRAKELLARVEREKQLQIENLTIRLQSLELEVSSLREEAARQKGRAERLEAERLELGEQLQETRTELSSARAIEHTHKEQEKRLTLERNGSNQLIDELSREVERLRSEARTPALPTTSAEQIRLEELHQEVATLRSTNKSLMEANEELQASLLTAGVEQGRLLTAGETSLAAELEAMSHDQQFQQDDHENLAKMQQALKEQQDVNLQLRSYIDGILLNIVENYPQLLEVKQRSA